MILPIPVSAQSVSPADSEGNQYVLGIARHLPGEGEYCGREHSLGTIVRGGRSGGRTAWFLLDDDSLFEFVPNLQSEEVAAGLNNVVHIGKTVMVLYMTCGAGGRGIVVDDIIEMTGRFNDYPLRRISETNWYIETGYCEIFKIAEQTTFKIRQNDGVVQISLLDSDWRMVQDGEVALTVAIGGIAREFDGSPISGGGVARGGYIVTVDDELLERLAAGQSVTITPPESSGLSAIEFPLDGSRAAVSAMSQCEPQADDAA